VQAGSVVSEAAEDEVDATPPWPPAGDRPHG
jgi:hypothetical protein